MARAKKSEQPELIKVTLVRSVIGRPPDQRTTVASLGLRRVNQTVEVADTPSTVDTVWQSLAATVPVLAGLNHAAISAAGVALDATAWKALPFVEGKSLRFDPTAT